tara:strand:- start:3981 stop:4250 length:270 start_codon:yes stop_codon:yes gene_type:complete
MADPIVLPSRLDLSSVPAVLTELTACPADESLVLDASQVVHFGALGMQVILSAFKTAGDRIQLINVSDKVLEQMRWMGMTPETIAEVAT